MKRALLIAGGTVGGLGAVLAITPPQLGSQGAMGGLSNIASAAATTAAPVAQTITTTPVASTPVATTPTANTSVATTVKKKKVTKKRVAVARVTHKTTTPVATTPTAAATTPTATTPTPVKSTPPAPAPATKKVSGTFTGNVVNVNYGNVQVQITVVDGKITDAQALQAPSGRSDRYTQYALPILRSQTLAAQGSNIQGASGASYTSYGWYTSLQAALAKAGL
jgi:uncharacterized protein with FMN-binding domain